MPLPTDILPLFRTTLSGFQSSSTRTTIRTSCLLLEPAGRCCPPLPKMFGFLQDQRRLVQTKIPGCHDHAQQLCDFERFLEVCRAQILRDLVDEDVRGNRIRVGPLVQGSSRKYCKTSVDAEPLLPVAIREVSANRLCDNCSSHTSNPSLPGTSSDQVRSWLCAGR